AREVNETLDLATKASRTWRTVPAPRRGEIVWQMRQAISSKQSALGQLVALEMGKIVAEGVGEVQEYVDVADFAVGLSRTLAGKVLPSERPGHAMLEVWNPLGVVGVVSAFNFPVAVYGWNSAVALVCGNAVVWKGAPSTSLASVAVTKILAEVLEANMLPGALCSLVCGGSDVGAQLADDRRVDLLSFTGSTSTGRLVADRVHRSIHDEFVDRLVAAYVQVRVGDPLEPGVLCGPLHSAAAVEAFERGVEDVRAQGGRVLFGGRALRDRPGFFVEPTLTSIAHDAPVVLREVFAPILHVSPYDTLDQAVAWNNQVAQGLSSSLFTSSQENMFRWIGPEGSDCGIVNVNIPTNGAEVGGAFGGEKETGGGRESGSTAWQQYMRRQTCTINYSGALPLAQGIKFE
ncbi:hypothetical protein GGI05_006843, partial [Coemansia sp. RSA 2603]